MGNFFRDKLGIDVPVRKTLQDVGQAAKELLAPTRTERSLFSGVKTAVKELTAPTRPEQNFFARFMTSQSPQGMKFEVGSGLTPEQKKAAERTVRTPAGAVKEGNFFADLLRIPVRTAASFITKQEFQPSTPAERLFLGTNAVKPASQRTAENELTLKEMGAGKSALPLAVVGVVGGAFLDLWPGLPGKQKLAKEVGEYIAERSAKNLSAKVIAEEVATKFGKEAGKEAERVLGKTILATEARKYKSAEEFVKDSKVKQINYENGTFESASGTGTKVVGTFEELSPATKQELIESKKALDAAKGTGAENSAKAGDRYFKAQETAIKEIEGKTKSQLTDIWKKANIDERLAPLADEKGMVTVYRASAKFPTDKLPKDTFVATNPNNARYYAESHYKGEPSDITVRSFKIPVSQLKRGGSADAWQLKEDFSVTDIWNQANKKPPFQAGREAVSSFDNGIPSKSNVAINLPETRSQELFTNLNASKPESVSTILNVSPSNFTNRSFIQHYVSTVQKISQESKAAFTKLLQEATGFKPDVRVKKTDSIIGKIERKLLSNKNPADISDNLAGRIVVGADQVRTQIENVKRNFKVIELDNFFENPTNWGYRGINVKVRLPNGFLAEVQIHTPKSLESASKIHKIYEKWRNLDLSNLTKTQKAEYLASIKKSNAIADEFSSKISLSPSKDIQSTQLAGKASVPGEISARSAQPTLQAKKAQLEAKGAEFPSSQGLFSGLRQSRTQTTTPRQSQKLLEGISSSSRTYTQAQKNAIETTAKQVKESPSMVQRVVDSVRKIVTNVVEYVQNSEERIRQLVNRPGLKVDDVSDPYLKATLYPGRVAELVNRGKEEARVVVNDMKNVADQFGIDLATVRKEVNQYLYFRHAPERNLALGEKAAGITTKEAQEGLKALQESPRGAKIKRIADQVQKLNNQTLDVLKESGVISDELYKMLKTKYKNHVPLQRIFEETEDLGSVLSGRGFDVRSTGIKRAKGSEREVDDIFANIITNYEQAVLRAEKNIVDQATLSFVRNNKQALGNLFEITQPRAIGTTFDSRMIMQQTQDPTILQMFENGKRIWIKINDPHLAVALRGIGREKLPSIFRVVNSFTRMYAGLATRFNPEFALPNKIRDLQETAVYLASQKGMGFRGAAQTVKRDLMQQNTIAVLDFLRGKDSEGARLYQEMKSLGGTTGGFGLSTKQNVKMSIEELERLATSKSRRMVDNLVKYVDYWNTIFEDSTRLSVYRQGLTQGLSKERAAFLAKEASINFNRMGKGGPIINSLWMFANASIQGSTKMIRSLRNPKVLAATVTAVGASVAGVNQWNDRVDPNWRDKVSKWDRMNGLPIVIPQMDGGVRYITIPVSWGLKPIKVMTDYAYDAVSGQEFDTKRFMEDTVTTIIEAYNPVGGSDLVSAITPTIIDVPVELKSNRSWNGNKIKPDYDPNAPEDIRYFDSLRETKTGQAAISISEALQKYARIAISPADIKYAYDQYIGGAGRAVSKTINTIAGPISGKPVPVDELPLISRFYRQRTQEEVGSGAGGEIEKIQKVLERQSRDRFELQRQAEELYGNLKTMPKDEANARAREIKQRNPLLYEKLRDVVQDSKLGLTYEDRLIKQLGVSNGERARYIWQILKDMPNKEEKNSYLKELRSKRIITDEVFEQLKILKNQ